MGILINEYIYFFNHSKELESAKKITNNPPADKYNRHYSPQRVYDLGDGRFLVLFKYVLATSRCFSILEISDKEAKYLFPPRKIKFDVDYPFRSSNITDIVIQSVTCSGNNILMHTIGPDHNWYKYGLEFSRLSQITNDYTQLTAHHDVEKGFGKFSSDKK